MSVSDGPSFSDISAVRALKHRLADDTERESVGTSGEVEDHSLGVPTSSSASNFFLSVLNAEPFTPAGYETFQESVNPTCQAPYVSAVSIDGDVGSWHSHGGMADAALLSQPGLPTAPEYADAPSSAFHLPQLACPGGNDQMKLTEPKLAGSGRVPAGAYLRQPHVSQASDRAGSSCLAASSSQAHGPPYTATGPVSLLHPAAIAEKGHMTAAEYLNQPHIIRALEKARRNKGN
mmetsp:Transcript_115879/g.322642  ORF Transcript_115879/g.322642 Transcript_115879/m.322642 type:complete len:234 (-) Transcript_115879:141-842(-)